MCSTEPLSEPSIPWRMSKSKLQSFFCLCCHMSRGNVSRFVVWVCEGGPRSSLVSKLIEYSSVRLIDYTFQNQVLVKEPLFNLSSDFSLSAVKILDFRRLSWKSTKNLLVNQNKTFTCENNDRTRCTHQPFFFNKVGECNINPSGVVLPHCCHFVSLNNTT